MVLDPSPPHEDKPHHIYDEYYENVKWNVVLGLKKGELHLLEEQLIKCQ